MVIILQAFLVRIEALPSYRPESRVCGKFDSVTPEVAANPVLQESRRCRLSATRAQLLAVLPAIQQRENTSALNQFIALDSASAPTLDAWLATTGRTPASEGFGGQSNTDDTAPPAAPAPADVCGTKITPGTTKLFDADAANAFNRDLPLRLLSASAETSTLPENLRYQVAQAALVRAILLDKPAIAGRMTPLLVHCRSAWAPVLAAYSSSTADERKLNGLLALMRFASTEPSVRNGEERRNGFATYDEYRQNWWCTTVPQPDGTVDDNPTYQYLYTYRTQLNAARPTPLPHGAARRGTPRHDCARDRRRYQRQHAATRGGTAGDRGGR